MIPRAVIGPRAALWEPMLYANHIVYGGSKGHQMENELMYLH